MRRSHLDLTRWDVEACAAAWTSAKREARLGLEQAYSIPLGDASHHRASAVKVSHIAASSARP